MANSLTNMVGEYLFEQRIRTDSASIESLAVRIAPLLAKGDTQELYTQLSTAGGELGGRLLVLDIKDANYFREGGASSQHGGGGLFARDPEIMGWLFMQR